MFKWLCYSTHEKTKVQKSQVICPKSHSQQVAKKGCLGAGFTSLSSTHKRTDSETSQSPKLNRINSQTSLPIYHNGTKHPDIFDLKVIIE